MVWPFKKAAVVPRRIVAGVPAGKTIARFGVLKEFPDAGSVYVPGLIYNVREGNKTLEQKVQDWVKEGKAKWL